MYSRKWGGGGRRCAQTGHPLKLPSSTKLGRLGHFPPASQAGRLAGPVFYVCTVYVFSLSITMGSPHRPASWCRGCWQWWPTHTGPSRTPGMWGSTPRRLPTAGNIIFKGIVSQDKYFFEGLKYYVRTFWTSADGFYNFVFPPDEKIKLKALACSFDIIYSFWKSRQ